MQNFSMCCSTDYPRCHLGEYVLKHRWVLPTQGFPQLYKQGFPQLYKQGFPHLSAICVAPTQLYRTPNVYAKLRKREQRDTWCNTGKYAILYQFSFDRFLSKCTGVFWTTISFPWSNQQHLATTCKMYEWVCWQQRVHIIYQTEKNIYRFRLQPADFC